MMTGGSPILGHLHRSSDRFFSAPRPILAMRRKPGIAGLIKEKEQQSALSAVGEQIEVRGPGGWARGPMFEDRCSGCCSGYR